MPVVNRESFISNIAHRLGRPRQMKADVPRWSVTPQYELYKHTTDEDLIEILENQCILNHTNFVRTDRDCLNDVLKKTFEDLGGKFIITACDSRNEEYGLTKLFHELKGKINTYIWDYRKEKENQKMAAQADIGINFSDITIAETATVTLFHDKNNGRSISVLPKYFIAIIPKETIVPRMTQAVQLIQKKHSSGKHVPFYISFNSGPSNSADIEMNLLVGVHGPIKATYILVE